VIGELSVIELVEAAKRGDHDAWNTLVERYAPLVVSVARRFRLDPDDLADVNQTVWLRLVEHLDDIREPRALPGWIATTAKNESLRLATSRGRTIPVDPLAGYGLEERDARPEVDEGLLREERRQALRDGFDELRSAHRELLMLLIAEPPLSYDEISERLDMPKGSIGPTRARCLEELRHTTSLRSLLTSGDHIVGR
jgi:RNA polymerase sigma factor (sigma-70 family)